MSVEPQESSPVNWHVAIWVLFSLCSNSMAQPSGKLCGTLTRYRLYLCSSPILCCADALCILIQTFTTSVLLGISPIKAASLVLERRSGSKSESLHGGWPRWIFFVMGPLPAAVKLASFSGTPWTQTWGMMFLSSFAVIELVTLAGKSDNDKLPSTSEDDTDLAALGQAQDNETRLNWWLGVIEIFIFIIAILSHLGLAVWAYETLWLSVIDVLRDSNLTGWMVTTIFLSTFGIMVITLVIVCILRRANRTDLQQRWVPLGTIWKGSFLTFIFSIVLVPSKPRPSSGVQWFHDFLKVDFCLGINWYFAVAYVFYRAMRWICGRFHNVGKILLIAQEQESAQDDEKMVERVDEHALMALSFFLTNVGVCTFWYAFRYDSVGTVNPEWTDVFG